MSASTLLAPIARRLEGKVAVITGGARGIGETTARQFLRHGAKVVIADVEDELAHSLCKDINNQSSLSYIHCDISQDSDVKSLIDDTLAMHGKLDIMFANAGISAFGGDQDQTKILSADNEVFKRVMDVNAYGSFLSAKHAARAMIPARTGSIIMMASNATAICSGVSHAYAASKYAVLGLTKNLGVELGEYGIRVNCLSPFIVDTPLLRKEHGVDNGEAVKDFAAMAANLKEVVLEANDVAAAALYLGSDEAKYVSGMNLVIDGGYSTTNVAIKEALMKMKSS